MQGLMPRGFSRFDIVEGYYWWLVEHHSGQWSEEYARQCKVSRYFTPSRLASGPEDMGQIVYNSLCEKHGCTH